MPEGPEVRVVADVLEEEVRGLTLLDVEYDEKSRYNKTGLVGLDKLRELLPRQITEVTTKGKKIIFFVESDTRGDESTIVTSEDEEPVFLISSLILTGRWSWDQGNHSNLWFCIQGEPDRRLYFDDTIHYGLLEIVFGLDDLKRYIAKIGPDLLCDDIAEEEWLGKIRNPRLRRKKIGSFLMEPKYFSGIGNYLRAEILYDARISPHRTLSSLSDEEALAIFEASRRIILESYNSHGLTIKHFWDPRGRKGLFKVKVYGEKHDPFGNEVITEELDKRTVHWVPAVQL